MQFASFFKIISHGIEFRCVVLSLAATAAAVICNPARAEWQIPIKPGFFALRTNSCDQGDMAAYFSQLSFWGDSINNSWTTRTIRSVARGSEEYVLKLGASQNGIQGHDGRLESAEWKIKVVDTEHMSIRGRDHGEDWSGYYRWCGPLPSEGRQAVNANAEYAASLRSAPPFAPTHGGNDPKIDAVSGEFAGEQGVPFIHNDSRVWLFPKAGIIAYGEPKRSIAAAVKPGDILFKGRIGAREISGTAYVFKAGCAPAPYLVNGTGFHGEGDRIVLSGAAPARDRNSCDVGPASATGKNGRLVFEGAGGFGE